MKTRFPLTLKSTLPKLIACDKNTPERRLALGSGLKGAKRLAKLKNLLGMATATVLLATALNAPAQDWDAGGDGTSWHDPTNWAGNNVPTLTNLTKINLAVGSDVIITNTAVANRFIIGQGATNIQKLTINSGSLSTDSTTDHRIGQTSEGWLTMNGGTLTLTNGGYTSDANGRLIINGGSVSIGRSTVGGTSAGYLDINGSSATFNASTNYTFGAFATVSFTPSATGATVVNNAGLLTLNATSTLNINLLGFTTTPTDLVLFDYGTLSGTFGTVNVLNGSYGSIDYVTGGQIRLTQAQSVPEPSALVLLGAGAVMLYVVRRRIRA